MRQFLSLFITITLVGCSSNFFNKVKVTNTDYSVKIPFDFDHNLPITDVVINGKTYRFLVDTGAPTLISQAIFEDLNIDDTGSIAAEDSQGVTKRVPLALVPSMNIGGLEYKNVGSVVKSMRDDFIFDCFEIDGIIGANVMGTSVWKFDYQQQEFTVTNSIENLKYRDYDYSIPFIPKSNQRTPHIYTVVEGQEIDFTYDTGSSGSIDISVDEADFENKDYVSTYGEGATGLFGKKDSLRIKTIKVDNIPLGNLNTEEFPIELDKSTIIGNRFLKNFNTIIDWNTNTIYMKPVNSIDKNVSLLGLGTNISDNKLVVTSLLEQAQLPLQLGDQIIEFNGLATDNINESNACNIFINTRIKDIEELSIIIVKNGVKDTLNIKRRSYL